jgi:prolyl 4-hydroxylase
LKAHFLKNKNCYAILGQNNFYKKRFCMKLLRLILLSVTFFCSVYAEYSIQTLHSAPRVYVIPNFLSSAECDHIIKEARPHLKASTVVDESQPLTSVLDPRRSSQGMFFPGNPKDKILRRIEKRIANLTGFPVENGEAIQVLHYDVGGEYQPHYDFFSTNTPGGISQLKRGGQRVATVIMYLNTPKEGGETIFPKAMLSITPKKGTALLFYNCTPDGKEDPMALHGGAPVKSGEKWIATKWIRFGAFY